MTGTTAEGGAQYQSTYIVSFKHEIPFVCSMMNSMTCSISQADKNERVATDFTEMSRH